MSDVLTGVFGIALVLIGLTLSVTWIIFPFLLLSRLSNLQRAMDNIEKHTKSQADFWRDRNVRID